MMHVGLAFAVLLSVASATPGRNAFTVHQEASGKKLIAGAVAIEETFSKFKREAPAHVKRAAAAARKQFGSVAANPEMFDREYLSPVSVGTPGQTLMMKFDTGSSDLWVYSEKMPESERQGHDIYRPGTSTTSRSVAGYSWKITYGGGRGAQGIVYTDKVVIGGVTSDPQAVEIANELTGDFSENIDGFVGLAADSINSATPQVKTFFENVKPTLRSPLFAANLRKGKPGSYDFGFIDTSKFTGAITYQNVDFSNGFWEFSSSGYAIGSQTFSMALDLVADTGTSLVYMPQSVVDAYYKKVSGASFNSDAGGFIFPCKSTLPSFSFFIRSSPVTVPGSYINYAPATSDGVFCFGGLQSSADLGINLVGDILLKSQYVVHDVGNVRIGFAKQK